MQEGYRANGRTVRGQRGRRPPPPPTGRGSVGMLAEADRCRLCGAWAGLRQSVVTYYTCGTYKSVRDDGAVTWQQSEECEAWAARASRATGI